MSVRGGTVLGIAASPEQYQACLVPVVLLITMSIAVDKHCRAHTPANTGQRCICHMSLLCIQMVAQSTQLAPLALRLWQISG
jgi:hypothetical protein